MTRIKLFADIPAAVSYFKPIIADNHRVTEEIAAIGRSRQDFYIAEHGLPMNTASFNPYPEGSGEYRTHTAHQQAISWLWEDVGAGREITSVVHFYVISGNLYFVEGIYRTYGEYKHPNGFKTLDDLCAAVKDRILERSRIHQGASVNPELYLVDDTSLPDSQFKRRHLTQEQRSRLKKLFSSS